MNRKLLLFAGVMFLLVVVKLAFGQTEGDLIGWDPTPYEDPADTVFSLMLGSPILGAVIGAIRVLFQRSARPVLQPIRLS